MRSEIGRCHKPIPTWALLREHFLTASAEVDRAIDNLVKSGKIYSANGRPPAPMMGGARQFNDYGMRIVHVT